MNWIKTSEMLPDTNREVLIFTDTGISIGVFDIECRYLKKCGWYDLQMWNEIYGYEEDDKVTHWMELPTKPIND
ncbi:MAG: DUF551 domain-containing protein [Nitrosopumilaceae archaeon]|nr:DUF551 domain-containing protein [Nitrosopumilaceae archaeon]